ncbi:MAG: spermine synthase [Betaproteobacteria bacterium]
MSVARAGGLFLPAMLLVFTASGFAGLIYESIWSHYLKLFLGHAAYAQTLVLAIFMGGMAIGAWGASRLSPRWRDPLLAYAVIEAVIGGLSLGFHEGFVSLTAWAHAEVIPALGAPAAIEAFKWSLAGLLILPQSVLLGMTFPLMTGGVLRARPQSAGYTVAMLYFTNSLGAAAGVLASGFYFIAAVGLPGALIAAGIVNLAVAALVMLLRPRSQAATAPLPAASGSGRRVEGWRQLLLVRALTGLSAVLYEIGGIRVLSLVLGSSTHSFELMLSAFILGLAFGGLWGRRRLDSARDTVRLLACVQLAMGAAALATLPLYGETFRLMEAAMSSLSRTDSGYFAFNLVSSAIALAIMFPAAFCAGMTLPLITASLLRRGAGERAVGLVYAANTAGAIAGVALAVHVGLPMLGLKGTIVAGAAIDVALGVVLLWSTPGGAPLRAALAGAAVLAAALWGVELDAHRMSSGVYRLGTLPSPTQQSIELQVDGKTATVSVVRNDHALALLTNGKSDGAIRVAGPDPTDDEIMMTLLGALPQLLAPQAKRVANIGFGTGMTTHVLLASKTIESVDTVEIEPQMVRAAQLFRPYNARALDDPRSRVHYEDAKTYFAARKERYDVIVSEPSNPWVSGVASLFSTEFYRDLRRHLKPGGLLLQWVHAYEMTPALFATIVRALDANFSDFELWMPSHGDLIIVAANGGLVPQADARALDNALLRAELERFRLRSLDDVLLHRIAGARVLAPYFDTYGVPANSDFNPILDLNAPRARFLRASAEDVTAFFETGLPLTELFDPRAQVPEPARLTGGPRAWLRRAAYAQQAAALAAYLRSADPRGLPMLSSALANDVLLARAALVECKMAIPASTARDAVSSIAWLVNAHLPRAQREPVWQMLLASPCAAQSGIEPWLRLHAAVAAGDAKAMSDAAAPLLDKPADIPGELLGRVVGVRAAALLLSNDAAGAQREINRFRGKVGNAASTQAIYRILLGQIDLSAQGGGVRPVSAK